MDIGTHIIVIKRLDFRDLWKRESGKSFGQALYIETFIIVLGLYFTLKYPVRIGTLYQSSRSLSLLPQ